MQGYKVCKTYDMVLDPWEMFVWECFMAWLGSYHLTNVDTTMDIIAWVIASTQQEEGDKEHLQMFPEVSAIEYIALGITVTCWRPIWL